MKKKSKNKKVTRKKSTYEVMDDDKWRAEHDARTLAEAEEIKGDKDRMSKAAKAAVKEAKEAQQKADALNKIAKKSKK